MILVDTSIWVDHLRAGQPVLARHLDDGMVIGHPWVTGELALGHLARRAEILGLLNGLPQATVASDAELMMLIERYQLFGLGIGYIDVQLLASTQLTAGANLWTADRRLAAAAARIGCAVIDRERS